MGEVLLWIVVIAIFIIGVGGSVLPVLPGAPIVFVGVLLFAVFTGFEEVTWTVVGIIGGVMVLSLIIDTLVSAYGAKRRGASMWGIVGGIVGGFAGLFVGGLPGLLLGIFAFSFLAEWLLGGMEIQNALEVGWASLLGFLGGTLMKIAMVLAMVGIFFYAALC